MDVGERLESRGSEPWRGRWNRVRNRDLDRELELYSVGGARLVWSSVAVCLCDMFEVTSSSSSFNAYRDIFGANHHYSGPPTRLSHTVRR